MADDLSQFFAKKSAKVRDKKKKVKHSVDEVGQVLERKAKRQEERDREEEEEEKRAQDEAAFFERRPEDSEWLEYKDTNKEIVLEELGIRDMNLTEQVEEALEDEKATSIEAPKTWNIAEKKDSDEALVSLPKAPAGVWKPRFMMLQNAKKTGVMPNINDQEMFPTFEAAEKIEKLRKDDDKKSFRKNDGFTMVTSERDTGYAGASRNVVGGSVSGRGVNQSVNADRAALFSTVRQVTSSGAPNPIPPSRNLQPRNPNVYIPPGKRQAQARSAAEAR